MLGGFQVVVSGVALVAVTLAGAATAAAQAPAEAAKPALLLDEGDAALIQILVKADKTADFELVLGKLKEALQKSDKEIRRKQAAGWKAFRSTTPGPNGSVIYMMWIDPVVKGEEYAMSRLIYEVFPTESQEIFAKYKEALVGQQTILLKSSLSMGQ
jgi:hypothetical protein